MGEGKDREKTTGQKPLRDGGAIPVTAGIATTRGVNERNNNATPSRLACRVSAHYIFYVKYKSTLSRSPAFFTFLPLPILGRWLLPRFLLLSRFSPIPSFLSFTYSLTASSVLSAHRPPTHEPPRVCSPNYTGTASLIAH